MRWFDGRFRAAPGSYRPQSHSHPFGLRREVVQLGLKERFPVERVGRAMGVGSSTLSDLIDSHPLRAL